MPYVTAIKPQKSKKRVNVYLDGKFAFGIDFDNLVKFKIKEGDFIDDLQVEAIIIASQIQKIWDKLLRFSALRPRSEKEIRDWFRRKKVPEVLRAKYLKKLKKLGFAGDIKFARFWVEQRLSFRPKPRIVLRQELRQKGVSEEIIKEVLSSFEVNELKQAKELIKKASRRWKGLSEVEFKNKATAFLLRRGYSLEVVKEALSSLLKNLKDNEAF